jgi:hypothetical protein
MKNFDEWNAGRFIRAGDYTPGDTFDVVVTEVTAEMLERERKGQVRVEEVLLLALVRGGKHWGLWDPNLTNRRILARLFGKDPMALAGKAFRLTVVTTTFNGGANGFLVQCALQQPVTAAPPPPRPRLEPPAAATRARTAPPPAAGNGQPPKDGLDELLDDEIPAFEAEAPAAAPAPPQQGRRPGRPRKEQP